MWSCIGDGNYLVHRTRTVDYQVLKGLPLVAVGLSLIIGHVLTGNKYLLLSTYSLVAFELRAEKRRRVASTNIEGSEQHRTLN